MRFGNWYRVENWEGLVYKSIKPTKGALPLIDQDSDSSWRKESWYAT